MLSVNSTIYEIAQAHKTMKLKEIADEIKVNKNELTRVFKYLGFEYVNKFRQWSCVFAKPSEKLERSFWSVKEEMENAIGNDNNTGIINEQETTDNQDITESNAGNNEIGEFTQEEIQVLKLLVRQHIATGTNTNVSNGSHSILEAIQSVPTGSTNKKTFVIQDSVIEQLDAFCDSHRIKKSDFLALAILETLRKYS